MRACLSLVVLFAACTVAVPAPAPTQAQQLSKRSFKVELVRNPGFVQRDALVPLPRVYGKFGKTDFSELRTKHRNTNSGKKKAASTNGTHNEEGSVTATGLAGGVEFVAQVVVGNQSLPLIMDTGSSDLWVAHTGLNSKFASETLFNLNQSPTFREKKGTTFNISYGDGSFASGLVGTDTVSIGGVVVPSLPVGIPTLISQSFADLQSSGILGLAFPNLNTVKPGLPQTFLQSALPNLDQPVFTANLHPNTSGTYEFGKIDDTKFQGNLDWASVHPENGFWEFRSSSVKVGADNLTLPGGLAIADTGTTLLIMDPRTFELYYKQVNVTGLTQGGNPIVPCDEALPDLSVAIDDSFNANIPGGAILFKQEDGTCIGGVADSGSTSALQIFGGPLFKGNFVAFNVGNTSIGVAPHN